VVDANDCILVVAIPGVGLDEAVVALGKRLDAAVADIEKEMRKDPVTKSLLKGVDADFVPPFDMQTIVDHIPRSEIAKLWKKAFDLCLQTLEESGKTIKILSGHLTYHSSKRSEFYSVANFPSLIPGSEARNRLKIQKIILLIDDTFDMYARLTKLYSPSQVEPFMRRMSVDPKTASKEMLTRATMAWKTRNILHLLAWRSMEPIAAENLARLLGADFLVWPVKQMSSALEAWITSETEGVYLSHPITDSRTKRNATGTWPPFVEQVNELQASLAKHGITLIEPTGIDELRFSEAESASPELRHYTGQLDPRWPLIVDKSDTLYAYPKGMESVEHTDFFVPSYWDYLQCRIVPLDATALGTLLKNEIHAYCQVLVGEIEAHVASRDFLFVYHSRGLLVFRPYWLSPPRPTFSSGVDAEVRLWEDIVQLGAIRRIAFVHLKEDVASMLQAMKNTTKKEYNLTQGFVDQMTRTLNEVFSIKREIVEGMVSNHGKVKQSEDVLNKYDMSYGDVERLEKAYPRYLSLAKIAFLRRSLSGRINRVKDDLIGIWVFENYVSLQNHLREIAEFLRNGWPSGKGYAPGNNWEKEIDSLFEDTLLS